MDRHIKVTIRKKETSKQSLFVFELDDEDKNHKNNGLYVLLIFSLFFHILVVQLLTAQFWDTCDRFSPNFHHVVGIGSSIKDLTFF